MIFAVGGGISAYEGLLHILDPSPLENPRWNYFVLGLAVLFESYSFYVACKAFQSAKGEKDLWHSIHTSKDPTTFTVLLEDAAALLGLLVAFIGVSLAHQWNNPYFDGSASIVIGVILAAVAVLLAYESKGLHVGEGADPETLREIRRVAESDPNVERVNRALTMYFGPHTVLLARISSSATSFQRRSWSIPLTAWKMRSESSTETSNTSLLNPTLCLPVPSSYPYVRSREAFAYKETVF
jgi:divalent metal cation (Fe/Co/Zn/Cd) transporter